MEEKKYYQIGSLEKGLRILEAIVAHGGLTVTEAANSLSINRASAHRFITTLRDMGYVRKNRHNIYEATFKLLELGTTQANKFEIRQIAKPVMRDLAAEFDETVNLGVLDDGQVFYLDKVESRGILRMDSGIGTASSPYLTALGKAMIAFLPEEERLAYVEKAAGHVDQVRFGAELAKIKKNGYAVDNEELSVGLYCIGAPVLDFNGYPAYAISVSGPVRQMKAGREIPGRLLSATHSLSKQLGYGGIVGVSTTRAT